MMIVVIEEDEIVKKAMLQFTFPGHAEHFNLGGIPKEGSILSALRKICPYVKAVHLAHSGSGRLS